jgi:uncharacterized protein DUF4259
MGAWGGGILDNDTALDWLGDLEEGGDASTVRGTLEDVADGEPSEDIETGAGEEALVAAEIVAAAAGRPSGASGEYGRLAQWARSHPDLAGLVALAGRAVDRVNGDTSELRELWLEGDADATGDWFRVVADLRARLEP